MGSISKLCKAPLLFIIVVVSISSLPTGLALGTDDIGFMLHCNGVLHRHEDGRNTPSRSTSRNISIAKDGSWINFSGKIDRTEKNSNVWVYEESRTIGQHLFNVTVTFRPVELRITTKFERKEPDFYVSEHIMACVPFKNPFLK